MGSRWGAAFVRIGWQASFGLGGSFAPDWVAGITGIRSQDAIDAWMAPKSGNRGAQPLYADIAIETALTLRLLFRLPLRQAEGFLGSVLKLIGLALPCPDHTTLSRRNATFASRRFVSRATQGPV